MRKTWSHRFWSHSIDFLDFGGIHNDKEGETMVEPISAVISGLVTLMTAYMAYRNEKARIEGQCEPCCNQTQSRTRNIILMQNRSKQQAVLS
jgi:hypothetical protein